MNKRNLFIFFLQIFTFSCVIGQDYSLFSYNKIFNIDYFTGNSLSQITNNEVLQNYNIIKSLTIEVKSEKSTGTTIYEYLEGKLYSITSNIKDGRKTIFKYNDNNFLESFDYQKRIYPQNNICLLYEDEELDSKITINDNGLEKIINIERPDLSSKEFKLRQIYDYTYKDSLLVEYIETYLNSKGDVYSKWIHKFLYNDDKLILHTVTVEDELRWEYELFYNDENQLIKTIYKDIRNPNNTRCKYFFDYDEYGNWQYSKEFWENALKYEVKRHIEYNNISVNQKIP